MAAHTKPLGRGADPTIAPASAAARALMGRLLDGRASTAQTAAFVMASLLKRSSLDELRGFVQAMQERCLAVPSRQPVVLLASYGGGGKLPNLTPLLAMWLAREGAKVLVHGPAARPGRVCTAAILADLGLPAVQQAQDIAYAWSRREPAFITTRVFCPALQALLDLRARIGLRPSLHTLARMINPVRGAPSLRLISQGRAGNGRTLAAWARADAADLQLLHGAPGEPVVDPRRVPRVDTWLAGVQRPELSLPDETSAPPDMPLLPPADDAAGIAVYVQEVLSGSRPVPAPLARQAALVRAALSALEARLEDGPD